MADSMWTYGLAHACGVNKTVGCPILHYGNQTGAHKCLPVLLGSGLHLQCGLHSSQHSQYGIIFLPNWLWPITADQSKKQYGRRNTANIFDLAISTRLSQMTAMFSLLTLVHLRSNGPQHHICLHQDSEEDCKGLDHHLEWGSFTSFSVTSFHISSHLLIVSSFFYPLCIPSLKPRAAQQMQISPCPTPYHPSPHPF